MGIDLSLPSLPALESLSDLEGLLAWAEGVYPQSRRKMRSSSDLKVQAFVSAANQEPTLPDEEWVAHVFVILPEKVSTYGGYQTTVTVRVTLRWPSQEIVEILYEP